jgi:hypothetical protein
MSMSTSVSENFKKINSLLIGRERKDATYKFALLRGAIEICEKSDQHRIVGSDPGWVTFPLGLLMEQWMLYYYPIYEQHIPQQKSEKNNVRKTKFRKSFDPVIAHYRGREGGHSKFASDLAKGRFSPDIQKAVFDLAKEICNKVTGMPMVHLGTSVNEKIFVHKKNLPRYDTNARISRDYLVNNFGTFSIRSDYYHAFVSVGPFITGDKSILFSWVKLTHDSMCTKKSFGDLLKIIASEPIRERDIQDSKTILLRLEREEGTLKSIWSGKTIDRVDEKVYDHLIPFSVWKNNELWNILPALKTENQTKSDFIPHPELLDRQKEHIVWYWNRMNEYDPDAFMKQLQYSLMGNEADTADWQENAFASLRRKCEYLIDVLGYQSWSNP